ncbi:hypothetical protein ACFQ1S_28285 [Kibdelosporangium lantanae]|uniref:Uncharacterized protein n=1 Tax=Kibdelosporangium lantanae TaxID=1497396 RepID=A0ABW3MEM7_9PSEU
MNLTQLTTNGTDLRALAAELAVPVVDGLQHQGDVSVVPAYMVTNYVKPRQQVPMAGVPVLRGESNGNTHLLLASGDVLFDECRSYDSHISRITLGCLLVGTESVAYLSHPEHGDSGIGPGRYVLRRKREWIHEQRAVVD